MEMVQMDDRSRYRSIIAITFMVAVGVLAFLLLLGWSEDWGGEYGLLMLAAAAILVILPLALLLKVRRDVIKGIPLEDERGRAVKEKAGYYTFMATIYIVLAFLYYDFFFVEVFNTPSLSPTEYFLVLDMVILTVYLAFWWQFSRRGVLSG